MIDALHERRKVQSPGMLPIRDTIPSRRTPWATWTLIAINIFVFVRQLTLPQGDLEHAVYLFGFVPSRYTHPYWAAQVGFPPHTYWPFLTSMFLHGGWFHMISNMWTLYIFGDNVEDRMGPVRFLFFYLACGVAAALVHLFTHVNSTMPVIGASGAIAGVLAAYMFSYPLARILCIIPVFFIPLFIEVYAFLFVLVWFVAQFWSGALSLMSPGQGGSVAWWEHIGGFVIGAAIFPVFLRKPMPAKRPPSVP